jgi:hypothetical protein
VKDALKILEVAKATSHGESRPSQKFNEIIAEVRHRELSPQAQSSVPEVITPVHINSPFPLQGHLEQPPSSSANLLVRYWSTANIWSIESVDLKSDLSANKLAVGNPKGYLI